MDCRRSTALGAVPAMRSVLRTAGRGTRVVGWCDAHQLRIPPPTRADGSQLRRSTTIGDVRAMRRVPSQPASATNNAAAATSVASGSIGGT